MPGPESHNPINPQVKNLTPLNLTQKFQNRVYSHSSTTLFDLSRDPQIFTWSQSPYFFGLNPQLISAHQVKIELPSDYPMKWATNAKNPPLENPKSYFTINWDAQEKPRALAAIDRDSLALHSAEGIVTHSYQPKKGGENYKVVVCRYTDNIYMPKDSKVYYHSAMKFQLYIPGEPQLDVTIFPSSCEVLVKGGIPPYKLKLEDNDGKIHQQFIMYGDGRTALNNLNSGAYTLTLSDFVDQQTQSSLFVVAGRPLFAIGSEAETNAAALRQNAEKSFEEKLLALELALGRNGIIQEHNTVKLETTGDQDKVYHFKYCHPKYPNNISKFSLKFTTPKVSQTSDGKFAVGDVGLYFSGLHGEHWEGLSVPTSLREYTSTLPPSPNPTFPSPDEKMFSQLLFSAAEAASNNEAQTILNDATTQNLYRLLQLNNY